MHYMSKIELTEISATVIMAIDTSRKDHRDSLNSVYDNNRADNYHERIFRVNLNGNNHAWNSIEKILLATDSTFL